ERCQDWPGDGGFRFAPSDAHRPPKAGPGVSYGTATADGLRALLACGVATDAPRARAALGWLERNFAVDRVPGFPEGHSYEQGLRLYWLCAASRAFAAAGLHRELRAGIARQVASLQHADGRVVGAAAIMKEDDPLVGTTLALLALAAAGQR